LIIVNVIVISKIIDSVSIQLVGLRLVSRSSCGRFTTDTLGRRLVLQLPTALSFIWNFDVIGIGKTIRFVCIQLIMYAMLMACVTIV